MSIGIQVCSLKLSKKLEELGVKQNSLFYWVKIEHTKGHYLALRKEVDGGYEYVFVSAKPYSHTSNDIEEVISAFTVAELGKILPFAIERHKLSITKHKDGLFGVSYHDGITDKTVLYEGSGTEANARAKMLIMLINTGTTEIRPFMKKYPSYNETDETQNGAYNPRMRY